MLAIGREARRAADALRQSTPDQRTRALSAMAREIRGAKDEILAANAVDLSAARERLTGPELDRLALNSDRLEGIAAGIEAVAAIKGINELNIGHAIVSRALFVGLEKATREMVALLD